MLEKEFLKIGLNDNEREVYLTIIRYGKISPVRISKETGINRTTVYSISRKLIGLGLISEDLGSNIAYLYADKPESLEKIFERDEREIKEKQEVAKQIVAELKKIPKGLSYSVPKIRFVEEQDLSGYLYDRYKEWIINAEKSDTTFWGFQDYTLVKHYGDWIKWSWRQSVSKNLKVKLFSNQSKEENEISSISKERKIKILPDGVEFDSTLWIIGDYTIMVQTRNKPHYLVEINDSTFARNQRETFKMLWKE